MVSSWDRRGPVLRWSCTGWTTPLQQGWACRSAPGKRSWPAPRCWGLTPGSCTRTLPGERTWSSRHLSTGPRLPGRDETRWSHTEAESTDCSKKVSEPGVWPTASWGTCRCPGATGRGALSLDLGESNYLRMLVLLVYPCSLWSSVFTSVQGLATCAVRLHTFIDLLPRSSKVSLWRHVLPETHLPVLLLERWGHWPSFTQSAPADHFDKAVISNTWRAHHVITSTQIVNQDRVGSLVAWVHKKSDTTMWCFKVLPMYIHNNNYIYILYVRSWVLLPHHANTYSNCMLYFFRFK